MIALVHRVSAASVLRRRAFGLNQGLRRPFASLTLETLPDPELPGPEWVLLRPILAGICGSDLSVLRGRSDPLMAALTSFPAVPGHEVVARVTHAGTASGVRVGETVVVDPAVSCFVRGIPPCPRCLQGRTALCERSVTREGGLSPGMMVGFHRDLPGGFSDRMRVHRSQLHRTPEGHGASAVSLAALALTEPLAVALHAVLAADLTGSERILVIGGGMIGLGTVWALTELGMRPPVVAVRHAHQADLAEMLGALRSIRVRREEGRGDVVRRVGGARPVRSLLGRTLWIGGFDVVFDAVGDPASYAQSLESVRSGGRVVRVGETGLVGGPKPAPVWAPDTDVLFPFAYGREPRAPTVAEEGWHTFDLVLARLSNRHEELSALVTHGFPLPRYREAFATLTDRHASHAVRVMLSPDDPVPLLANGGPDPSHL